MMQWIKNGWQHWEMTVMGACLAVAMWYQQEFKVSSIWLSALIFVLGWVVKTPKKE